MLHKATRLMHLAAHDGVCLRAQEFHRLGNTQVLCQLPAIIQHWAVADHSQSRRRLCSVHARESTDRRMWRFLFDEATHSKKYRRSICRTRACKLPAIDTAGNVMNLLRRGAA